MIKKVYIAGCGGMLGKDVYDIFMNNIKYYGAYSYFTSGRAIRHEVVKTMHKLDMISQEKLEELLNCWTEYLTQIKITYFQRRAWYFRLMLHHFGFCGQFFLFNIKEIVKLCVDLSIRVGLTSFNWHFWQFN